MVDKTRGIAWWREGQERQDGDQVCMCVCVGVEGVGEEGCEGEEIKNGCNRRLRDMHVEIPGFARQ